MPQTYFQGGWVAPSPTNFARENWRTSEKMSGGPRGVKIPAFLPYFLDDSGETAVMRLYYRKMLADPVVKAAVLGKLMAVCALDIQIHPVDKKNALDREIAEFVQWNLTERIVGGFEHLVWNVFIGMLIDGLSVTEPIWRVEADSSKWLGKWVVAEQKAKDVDNDMVLDIDEFKNIVGIRGLRFNAGETFDPREFIIARHMTLNENPGGMSDFRAAYRPYWIMDTAWKLRASGLERRSMPILFGTYATASQKPSLETALAQARYNNWISAPEGARVEVKDIGGRSQDEFRNAIQDLREEIFLAIQGAMLQSLTGGQGTERGNSKVHESTANLLKWALSKQICSILNNHEYGLIRSLVRLNYGHVDMPRAVLDAVDDAELAQALPVDQGLHQLGLSLSKEQLREKYGRLPPMNKEDELPGIPQQPPPGAPGAPGMGGPPMGMEPGMDQGGGLPPEQAGAPQEEPSNEELPPDVGMEDESIPGQEFEEAAALPQKYTDQNLFTGKMRMLEKFAERRPRVRWIMGRWNAKDPTPREMEAVGRKFQRSGLVAFHDGKAWQAVREKEFDPAKMGVA